MPSADNELPHHAVLRSELTQTPGVQWTPVRKGIAEVAGVPRSVLKAFSGGGPT